VNPSDKERKNSRTLRSSPAYRRLEQLYEISKDLANFTNANESFPKILSRVAGVFPILSAVLIEERGNATQAIIWPTSGLSDAQVKSLTAKAEASFSYYMKSSPAEIAQLQSQAVTISPLRGEGFAHRLGNHAEDELIFPLAVNREPIFGVVLLEGSHPLTEDDVRFADALSNLIAVALDRSNRVRAEREFAQAEKSMITSERDYSRMITRELEEERGLREKFVHTLTHDLRTPLSSISISAQLLARLKALGPGELEVVKRLIQNTKRLGQMIDSLLDASRLKAGEKLPLNIKECDFGEVVREAVSEMNELARGMIRFECPEVIRGYWDGDALRRLAENLIGNAIKYGKTGIPIQVHLKKVDGETVFSVHNEGDPISVEDQKTLFNQFRRTASARHGGKSGWGLGLTLVRGIAEAHGGKVWLESGEGKGTTFFVQIPCDSRPYQGSAE